MPITSTHSNVVWWKELDKESYTLAKRRTLPLIMFYGRNISTMTLAALASSCYLAGIRDLADAIDREAELQADYSI